MPKKIVGVSVEGIISHRLKGEYLADENGVEVDIDDLFSDLADSVDEIALPGRKVILTLSFEVEVSEGA